MSEDIRVMQNILSESDKIAADIDRTLRDRGVYAINVIGAPGAGKTSAIIGLLRHLPGVKGYVVEGDITSDIDTQTLKRLGIEAIQLNTGGACHIDASLLRNTLESLNPGQPGLLFIENIGNLVCPAEFSIGERDKVLVVTAADGSDKPYKYPLAFEKAAAIVLNKADLLPYVDFDMDYFMRGVRALNPDAPVFVVSARVDQGLAEVADWILSRMQC
ncbi:MAG: hydrogenase nickel incorporation protein HypB [Clostridiales bacterium]|nr:hydrogenase nickel incorporation protein HypB [Clostridiales bacterium]